jgi:tetratricopeptide (TPR) repeat protein
MNISKIQRMTSEGDLSLLGLRYLLNCKAECEHLDFKVEMNIGNDQNMVCICKDIIGMKNVGGGYIIIGVEDKTWAVEGLKTSLGLDSKMLREKIQKYSGLNLEIDLVEYKVSFDGPNKLIGMILVRSSAKLQKLKVPSVCKNSFAEKEKWGIRQGDIYYRDGDQTKRADDLDKLWGKLEDLAFKYQEAEQYEASVSPSPFEVERGLFRLLPKEYENFVGRELLINQIKEAVLKDKRLWIINLHGRGGVGKSALATRVAYDFLNENKFEAILHLSAKESELQPGYGIRRLTPSLKSIEDFIDRILHLFSHQEYCKEDLSKKKMMVNEFLEAWSTLIILDNMETIDDGRIMNFINEFPPETQAKVLLTSRERTSGWEIPIHIPELSKDEVREFIKTRSNELNLDFPYENQNILDSITQISGGLPLALQWILGEYTLTRELDPILTRVISPDSPLLEFSFRNSWEKLDVDAQQALSVLPIFESPPTLHEWRTVLNWSIDKADRAKGKLVESTFVTERTDQKTGEKVYIALPITLSFSKNELKNFGDLSLLAKSRYEDYKQRLSFADEEYENSEHLFKKFNARTENQKRAILLSRLAEGQITSFGYKEAEEYYTQALEIDPQSIYALVSYGTFKSEWLDSNGAIGLISSAIPFISRMTGFYVYYNLADVYGKIRDWDNKVMYLRKAIEYEINNNFSPKLIMAKHSLGVALGHLRRHKEAIIIFDEIIENELKRPFGPSRSLVIAARTKKISLSFIDPKLCKLFIDDLISKCEKEVNCSHIIEELKHIRDLE